MTSQTTSVSVPSTLPAAVAVEPKSTTTAAVAKEMARVLWKDYDLAIKCGVWFTFHGATGAAVAYLLGATRPSVVGGGLLGAVFGIATGFITIGFISAYEEACRNLGLKPADERYYRD